MALVKDLVSLGWNSQDASHVGDDQELNITATGTTQATAFPITKGINAITGGDVSNYSVVLPPIAKYKQTFILIRSIYIAFNVYIFPATGELINGLAINAPITVVPNTAYLFAKYNSSSWISIGGT